jgi:hypothetical protein
MNGALFNARARDNCLEPFIMLRDELARLGYLLKTADSIDLTDCVAVWFWDARAFEQYQASPKSAISRLPIVRTVLEWRRRRSLPILYQAACKAGLRDKIILFTGEPPSVLPINFDPCIHSLFARILTWHDDLIDSRTFFKFLYPQPDAFPEVDDVPFDDRRLLVNISGRKQSNHERELYSARIRLVRLVELIAPSEVALYGSGWEVESPALLCFRGRVDNKWEIYPHFKFGLCYENIRDEPGYVTEKIFDCLRAKCVPIYWGAGNILDYVDEGSFIDRSRFSSDHELIEFILKVSPAEYGIYRRCGDAYLKSVRFNRFRSGEFAKTVIAGSGVR